MGTRGRKPKPTALKKLAGNPGKRPLNENEPQAPGGNVAMPRGRLNAAGRKLWRDLAPLLSSMGVLKDTDRAALEMMCMHYGLAVDAQAELVDHGGITFTDDKGNIKRHPAAMVLQAASAAFRMYATEFGLTPSSRSRLQVDELDNDGDLATILFKGISK